MGLIGLRGVRRGNGFKDYAAITGRSIKAEKDKKNEQDNETPENPLATKNQAQDEIKKKAAIGKDVGSIAHFLRDHVIGGIGSRMSDGIAD